MVNQKLKITHMMMKFKLRGLRHIIPTYLSMSDGQSTHQVNHHLSG